LAKNAYAALVGDQLYLRIHKDAPRFKIIRISLAAPDLRRAEVIVPEGRAVLQDFKVVGEHVLTRSLDGGIWRLQRVHIGDPAGSGEVETVPLPFNGTITGGASNPTTTTVLLQMTS
jgi:prolyl oligopeptidase